MGAKGQNIEQKINQLVDPLDKVLSPLVVGGSDIRRQATLFQASRRSVVWAPMFTRNDRPPYIMAGIVFNSPTDPDLALVCNWIETAPGKKDVKPKVREVVSEVITSLKDRNNLWQQMEPDSHWDVALSVPIHHLMTGPDQKSVLTTITQEAVQDLLAVDIVGKLSRRLGG